MRILWAFWILLLLNLPGRALEAQEFRNYRQGPHGKLSSDLVLEADYKSRIVLRISADTPAASDIASASGGTIRLDFGEVDAFGDAPSRLGKKARTRDNKGAAYQVDVIVEVGVSGMNQGVNVNVQPSVGDVMTSMLYEGDQSADFRRPQLLQNLRGARRSSVKTRLRNGWHRMKRQLVLFVPDSMRPQELQGSVTYTLSVQ